MQWAGAVLMGLTAGTLSAMLGIGGGVVIVPILIVFFNLNTKVAIATSLAYIVPIALAGAAQHAFWKPDPEVLAALQAEAASEVRGAWRVGSVEFGIALMAVPFGLIGTFIGKRLHDVIETRHLTQIFGVLMLVVGLKMAFFPGGWSSILGGGGAGPDEQTVATAAEAEADPSQ